MLSTSHPLCRDGSTTAITWCGVMAVVLIIMHISSLSTTPDCICEPIEQEGWKYSQFVGYYFHDCIYTPREYLSLVLGLFSIIGWFALLFPTLIHNYRTKTANQLTWMWIVIWICGDATNLWACIMTRNLQTLFKVFHDPSSMYLFPFLLPILVFLLTILSTTHTPFSQTPSTPHYLSLMVYIGLYFVAADLVMLMQWLYYHHVYPRMYGVEYPQAEVHVMIDKETSCHTTPTSSSIPGSRYSSAETSPILKSHVSPPLSYDSTAVGEAIFSLPTHDHDQLGIYQPSRHMVMHKTTPPPPRRIKVGLKAYTQQVKMERKLSATKGVRMMVLMAFVIIGTHQFIIPSDMQQQLAHISSLDNSPSTGRVLLSLQPDPSASQLHPISTSTSPPLCNAPPILTRGQLLATFLMSWCSSLLYLYSRIPAIRRHYQLQQVPNISMYVMIWAIIANSCYGACLVLRLPPIDSHVFWYTILPYVCAALGTAALDCIIVIQFHYYRRHQPYLTSSSSKLVSDAEWQPISTDQVERSLIV